MKVSVHDVAAYVLEQRGPMTALKLNRLVYYCQAWHLAFHGKPMFAERYEAWAGGPMCPDLYEATRFPWDHCQRWPKGDPSRVRKNRQSTVDEVLHAYSAYSSNDLACIAQRETPWIEARRGLNYVERGHRLIPVETMRDYFANRLAKDAA